MLHATTLAFLGMHLFWWAFWILLIVGLFATVTPVPKSQMRAGDRLDILSRRYAAGRFSTEEFERRKAVLERDDRNHVPTVSSARAHSH